MTLLSQSIIKTVGNFELKGPVVSDVLAKIREALEKEFGDDLWRWYEDHKDDVIYTIKQKVWFITVNFDIRVRHARKIFIEIAGPQPGVVPAGMP